MESLQAFILAIVLVVGASLLAVFISRGRKSVSVVKPSNLVPLIQRPSISEDPSKPRVRILFGTQTGTAERFSKQLAAELRKKYGGSTAVDIMDIEHYKSADKLPLEKLVVFCMATYGDGEPTDNAADFYSWLGKEAEAVSGGKDPYLQGVAYAVFGLGNRQYEHFNSVGKKVHACMETLGAKPLIRRGDGDDDGVIDDDFDKWCAELYAALDASSDLVGVRADQNGTVSKVEVPPAAYDATLTPPGSNSNISAVKPFSSSGSGLDVHSPFWASVTVVRELHSPASDRSCVHVELDVSGSAIRYETGDHVAIHAQNLPAVVQQLASLLGVGPLDSLLTLRRPTMSLPGPLANGNATANGHGHDSKAEEDSSELPEPPFTGPLLLSEALGYFADVTSSPRREALLALAAVASDPAHVARLRTLGSSSPEGRAAYSEYIAKPRRSLLEVLADFPSAKPPLGLFFASVAPRLLPRFYSISSSSVVNPTSVHVTCAVVRESMPSGRVHEGICSTWLAQHAAGSVLPVYVRRSHFKLPKDVGVPIIMIGPGTGLAPFRGFLQERAAFKASGTPLGPAHLFFGCRNRSTDFIYEEELTAAVKDGALTNLHIAFSRDGPEKVYVQHHLEREAAVVWQLLSEEGAYLYVCGDAKGMAKDVQRALVGLVAKAKGCSGTAAETWVQELSEAGRYQRDVW